MKKVMVLIMVLPLIIVSSCEKFLEENPESLFHQEKDEIIIREEAIGLVNGIYSAIKGGNSGHYVTRMQLDQASSYVTNKASVSLKNSAVAEFRSNPQYSRYLDMWEQCYQGIHRANYAIEKISQMTTSHISDNLKNRLFGEARFLRAFFYFELVRYFGKVPLITEVQSDFNQIEQLLISRESVEKVYNQIIEDFKFAEENLWYKTNSSFSDKTVYSAENLGRATVSAARGYLAKVYLTLATCKDFAAPIYGVYDENYGWVNSQIMYDSAIVYASKVVQMAESGGRIGLVPDFPTIFLENNENNEESLFEAQCKNIDNTGSQVGVISGPQATLSNNVPIPDRGYCRIRPTIYTLGAYEVNFITEEQVLYDETVDGIIGIDGSGDYYVEENSIVIPLLNENEEIIKTIPVEKAEYFPYIDQYLDYNVSGGADAKQLTLTQILDVENSDPRYFWTIAEYQYSAAATPIPIKKLDPLNEINDPEVSINIVYNTGFWKNRPINTPPTTDNTDLNWILLRYADVLLILAEALNERYGPGTSSPIVSYNAYQAINKVRARARDGSKHEQSQQFPGYPASSEPKNINGLSRDDFREIVRKERVLELVVEGHGFFDLVRTGKLISEVEKLGEEDAAVGDGAGLDQRIHIKDVLFPIPQFEIDKNPNLTQNPGW